MKENEKKVTNTIDKPIPNDVKVKVSKKSESSPSKQAPSAKRRTCIPKFKQRRLGVKNPNPNLHYHLANDKDGNVSKMRLAGYDPVQGETEDDLRGTYSSSQIGALATQDAGAGLTAIWMSIPLKEWERQQKEKIKETAFIDDQVSLTKASLSIQDAKGVKDNVYRIKEK